MSLISVSPGWSPETEDPTTGKRVLSSEVVSLLVTSVVTFVFVMASSNALHWFVVPVYVSGVIIGVDAVDWMRGRTDVFDPVGIAGAFGYHFFFLAPLLHVRWDVWMKYVVPPPDWRPWLGRFAVINVFGLVIYRLVRRPGRQRAPRRRTVWQLNPRTFLVCAAIAMAVTAGLQMLVFLQLGGVSGYVREYAQSPTSFKGFGWIFLISETFPILAVTVYAVLARNKKWATSPVMLAVLLLGFFVLKLLFGGLRGNRSNTLFDVIWAVGIIHLWLRPVDRKLVAVGVAFMVLFAFFYGFYKERDLVSQHLVLDPGARAAVADQRGRSFDGLLLGDLGRTDVQAFILYRLSAFPDEYRFGYGRTYVGDVLSLVPSAIWPGRPAAKTREGTLAQYGPGGGPGGVESSRQYGLAGEALLNFGPFAAPLAFIVMGLIVRRVRREFHSLMPDDSRLLLFPLLVALGPIVMAEDLDNVAFYLLQHAMVPFVVVALGSTRRSLVSSPEAAMGWQSERSRKRQPTWSSL